MNKSQHLSALSRLFYLQCFSLPRFVASASPQIVAGDEHLLEVLERVVTGQEHMASLVADAILTRQGRLPRATFPMRYTGLHDLEIRYLFACILEEQRAVVRELHAAVAILAGDEEAQQLASELRRMETAHLALFEELCSSHLPMLLVGNGSRDLPVGDRQHSATISENGSTFEDREYRVGNRHALVVPFSMAC